MEFYHNDNLIALNGLGNFDCRIKKVETYYNRNTTEYRMAYYNDMNGDYSFFKIPPKEANPSSPIVITKEVNSSESEGNLIILGTLLFIPFSIIITCIIGCCCCKRQRISTRRKEFETPLG